MYRLKDTLHCKVIYALCLYGRQCILRDLRITSDDLRFRQSRTLQTAMDVDALTTAVPTVRSRAINTSCCGSTSACWRARILELMRAFMYLQSCYCVYQIRVIQLHPALFIGQKRQVSCCFGRKKAEREMLSARSKSQQLSSSEWPKLFRCCVPW